MTTPQDPAPTSVPTPAAGSADAAKIVAEVQSAYTRLKDEVHKVIVGQDAVVDQILMAVFCRGHALVVGVPGLAKTLLISTLARTLSLGFSRIQFTPDLMPSDITGTEVIEEDKATGVRGLRFVKGPIFANVILADEVNRTPPKTQAALLEAMQERQVTIGGMQHKLPQPFFVLATQNPIEQEGTYPLPEAQLDRFMFQVQIGYPTADEELAIVQRSTGRGGAAVEAVMTADEIEQVQALVRSAPVAEHVLRYALRLVRATRIKEPTDGGLPRPKMIQQYVGWGAGPRASEYLVLAAKARAILTGSYDVRPEHVRDVAKPILRHRILTNFNAEADGVTTDAIIDALLKETPVDGSSATEKRQLESVIR
ncbi:MAG: MoxR family ATPase [Planctomycetaceae bacterium]|jgi:MoxR-like ATPase|nr:MoxR family ATPase [Phycisphaerales bacterium]MCE2654634.1 MoxR family ATPase [Planctomycetaceae bacterium]